MNEEGEEDEEGEDEEGKKEDEGGETIDDLNKEKDGDKK